MLAGLLDIFKKSTEFVVEEADASDLHAISEIHAQGFVQSWSDGDIARMLANDAYLCLVALPSGKANRSPAGFILLRRAADEAEIISIAVQQACRGKGIARLLLAAVVRRLQADRFIAVFLEVDETNKAAIGLYRRRGFRQIGERKSYYRGIGNVDAPGATALVMRLDLG